MFLPRLLAAFLVLCLVAGAPARAQVTLLRDADMEHALDALARPVLRAAGLSPSQLRILVIDDGSLNAFVADTSHVFIHSGLLLKLDSAAQLQAVIAHEAAHIANGHIARRMGNMRSARTAAGLGLLLAAAAIALGTQGSAMRRLFKHTRAEESAADISSVRYMMRAGLDPRGALEVQEMFRGQEVLAEERQDPYMRTHPLSRDRLRALEALVASQPRVATDPVTEYWFQRAQGKLSAFQRAPRWTLRRADESISRDIALMRKAVAHHRQSDTRAALQAIDAAIALRPNDPFLRDLKGQILLESRNFGAAVQVYRAAAQSAPREALILGGHGRALLAAGDPGGALRALEASRGRDFTDARVLRDLAVAYARTGNPGMASVVTAERYALQGRMTDAALHAERAMGRLARGSGPWQRAEDVLLAARRALRR
jgi:predicted Zn-dependent protease